MSATLGTRRPSNDSVLKTTTWGTRLALLALIILLAAGLSLADGHKHKVSQDLEALKSGPSGSTVDVIIQFNQAPTDAHHQRVQDKGGVLKRNLDLIKGAHYSVPVESLERRPRQYRSRGERKGRLAIRLGRHRNRRRGA